MRHHDLVIIGTGSGNSLLTPELAGLDVAIVEEGTFGGTCLNVGCIPTKMLVVPADRMIEASEAARLGVHLPAGRVDWPEIRDRVFGRIDPIAAGGEEYRRSDPHVTVYAATARFSGPRRLALSTGEEITGERVVVAAGSRPVLLDVPGLDRVDPAAGVHTSDTVMRIESLPRRLAVIGGGFVACELAHVFSAYGVDVIQIHRGPELLRREEVEVRERYTRLAATRMDLRLNTQVTAAERTDTGWRLTLSTPGSEDGRSEVSPGTPPPTVEVDAVLAAVGRTPNSDRLDCAAGGLAVHPDGRIQVDDQLRTTADGVWALGDVCGAHQLKHVANHEARIVAHNLAVTLGRSSGTPRALDDRPVPHAVFGHPQIAAFGPTRAELDDAGTDYVSSTQKVGDTAYGWALEDEHGLLTVHATPQGRILAAHCLAPHASTLIQPLIQAASLGQHAQEVARGQYWIHPALAEVVENALLGLPLTP